MESDSVMKTSSLSALSLGGAKQYPNGRKLTTHFSSYETYRRGNLRFSFKEKTFNGPIYFSTSKPFLLTQYFNSMRDI